MQAADRAVEFFPDLLKHHMGEFAGQPFHLLEYQKKLMTRPLFGWKRVSDGYRRFRRIFAFIPKGGGKSPWAAGTGVYLVRCDGEMAAEVYALANDRTQARTVHTNAKYMVEDSPYLNEGAEILKDSIYWLDTRSVFMVLSSDASSAHGKRPHGLFIDELHGFVGDKDRELVEALKKSMGKRRQPVLGMISHAGTEDESICVAPETRILTSDLRWVRAADVQPGDVLAGFDEHRHFKKSNQKGVGHRMWRPSPVLQKSEAVIPSYALTLSDGTEIVCSENHMWLVQTAGRRIEWKKTKHLAMTDGFCKVLEPWMADNSHEAGYLAGVLDSEGHLSATRRAHMLCGFTQRENVVAVRCREILNERKLKFGIYETTHKQRQNRVFQTMVTRKRDVLRMLGSVRPPRLLERFNQIGWEHLRLKAFERPTLKTKTFVGPRHVIGLKTQTHTFVAEGLASHNCHEEYDYAKNLVSGTIEDDSFLPVVFEATPTDDWTSPEVHARVNPGYGITIKADAVEMECLEALNEPRKRNDFLRYNLNRWVNQATAWLPVEWWDACDEAMLQDAELATLACAAGLDLAQKYDLACFAPTFRKPLEQKQVVEVLHEEPTGAVQKRSIELNYKLIVVPFFWIPEETMRQREREDRVPYSRWVELGLVTPTEGAIIDYTRIYTDIKDKIMPRFPRLKEGGIGYDPAFATDLATKLRDLLGFKIAEVLQNYSHLSEPSQIFEALIKARRVVHGANKVLRNHIENVTIKTDDARRIRPVKPKAQAGKKRIDGVVASLMGLKQLAAVPDTTLEPTLFFLGGRK